MISNYEERRPKHRQRTLTREMAPFWMALAYRTHDALDKELMAAEWAGFPEELRDPLGRAGLTCQRQVEALPDFLLKSIPNVGPVRLAQLRGLLPYNRAPLRPPNCPAKRIEADRWLLEHTRPIDNLHLVEGQQLDVTSHDDTEPVFVPVPPAQSFCLCSTWARSDVTLHPSGHHPFCPTLRQPYGSG